MVETGIKLTRRDISWLITIIVIVGGFVIRTELLNSKVNDILESRKIYNPEIISTNVDNMSKDVTDIKDDVEKIRDYLMGGK